MPPTRPSTATATPPYPSSRPGSSRPDSPAKSATANSSLILRKQLMADDRPTDTLWEGAILKARLIFPPPLFRDELLGFPARADHQEYPLLPPKMVFDSEMWHPNIYNTGARKGEVCVSILHAPGEDQWGYEDAGERWLPVHTVETVLISVISLLSADVPDLNSPANVDAAKEVREDYPAYKKRVKRLARRSAEEAYD
ncbi:ubiquitin conjugating enzyme [Trichosporon asahii var. asahii CBS 2479]|uniref:Ubiquitin conjugating enzyme n=1 Tax=Trichosporon asahii var. asahii (strain ATCC 90039 / CBS 2479 / JCM 2466 / KCTC 7840 / NBRC 103889/ NCYC 2677 / UAMH 7654) TaxID=1186058 RepID=J6EWU2_TRIAS|nr:ubiquitin conjugating enzyme [Trichosporon asahii var. asahii CBS 2479]EJT49079.1 ubiquitin conjugating enzyme [Trichosporon asahii var. asahii CBS 2479]